MTLHVLGSNVHHTQHHRTTEVRRDYQADAGAAEAKSVLSKSYLYKVRFVWHVICTSQLWSCEDSVHYTVRRDQGSSCSHKCTQLLVAWRDVASAEQHLGTVTHLNRFITFVGDLQGRPCHAAGVRQFNAA